MRHITLIAVLCAAASAVPRWHQVPFSYSTSAVRLDSDSTGWAAGTVGPRLYGFLKLSGGNWTLRDTFRNQLVYDIDIAGDTAWAVGEQFNFPDGIVWRNAGAGWSQQTDPFDRTLQAVSFPEPGIGFAGGASPAQHHPVMRFEGGAWRIDSTLTTDRVVLGLWATYRDKCIAVGDSGAVFHFDNDTWVQKRPVTGRHLRRVEFESNTEGWAVGDGGVILRCFKDTWAIAPSPTRRNLRGLAVAGTSGEAWAVGDSGTILHMVRGQWQVDPFVPDPPHIPLYAVDFNSGSEGWAFGYNITGTAVALHYYDDGTGVEDLSPPRGSRLDCRPSVVRRGASLHIGGIGAVEVLNCAGQAVRTVKLEARNPNDETRIEWDGRDDNGALVSAGCYLVRRGKEQAAIVLLQ